MFSGLGFALIFFLLMAVSVVVGIIGLFLSALSKPTNSLRDRFFANALALLFAAVFFEPAFLLALRFYVDHPPTSETYTRLGTSIWLPMPILSIGLSVRALFLAWRSGSRTLQATAIALTSLYALQLLWFLS